MRISVVLPAPFSPSSAWTSPRPTSRSTASLARRSPNRLVMARIRTAGTPPSATGSLVAIRPGGSRSPNARVPTRSGGGGGRGLGGRAGRLRLVDVHPQQAGLDVRLRLGHLVDEGLRDATGDAGVDRSERRATLAHHRE